ncbi:hypothetical protein GALL_553930 [mine drainage metagenome]|uniref:Uncharacterized protein n=1 Tax=mine drainage metagenome TaxID=410659 RepID=A0A1J5NWG1_9ZZZZ
MVGVKDDIGRGNVAIGVRYFPQQRHHREHKGIDDDGIGQSEEAVGADGVDQRRYGNHGVCGIEIPADQEPGDPGAELSPAQSPFVEMGADRTGFPARGEESHHGDEGEEEDEDRECDPVDLVGHDRALLEIFRAGAYGVWPGVRHRYTSQISSELIGTQASWYQ